MLKNEGAHGDDPPTCAGRPARGLKAKAAAAGKTVEELAEETLRASIPEPSWEDLLAYGLENGRQSGYTEEDVPRLVKDFRRE